MFRLFLFLALSLGLLRAQGIDLRLPTDNEHLFHDQPEQFYMYVDRIFEGETSKPWQGGCYGYVRNSCRINGQVIQTKLHEGIDIKPLKRDAQNRPLDEVRSIAKGRVAYVGAIAGQSNYGRYVVIEHSWENSSIYSLYAHLAEIHCKYGDNVEAGTPIGILGCSGSGLNLERAHVHLELGMMMSTRFDVWAKGTINHHGNFNGMNLCGTDVARFFLEHRANPQIKFSEFVASTPVYFKAVVPFQGTPDFVKRHPWICHGDPTNANSWEISFSATGVPVAFTPSPLKLKTAVISAVRPSDIPHAYLTRYLIKGEKNHATLGDKGIKLISLIMDNF